jgi:lipoprotein-anchoring transpeptidase ErfK/SrfK
LSLLGFPAIDQATMQLTLILLLLPFLFVSCALQGKKDDANAYKAPRAKIVATTDPSGPLRVDISLATMTAQLLQGKDTLLAEMDVSTGEAGHRTPKGVFRISEKMPLKRSNLYGQYVKKDTREVIVARHWEHKGPRPPGTVYQGIAMPYWMRLTAGGVGMHVGQFPRGITTSKGCIRCPEDGQTFFYQHCRIGTPVKIHDGPHPLPSVLDE